MTRKREFNIERNVDGLEIHAINALKMKNTFSTGLSLDFFFGIADESSGGSGGFLVRIYSLD